MRTIISFIVGGCLFVVCSTVCAQVPEQLNYQGRLIDDGMPLSGDSELVFRIYDAVTAGTLLYTETQTVTVVDGFYATRIGASNGVAGSLSGALGPGDAYLEIVVDGQTMTPRERVVASAYALHADSADSLASGVYDEDWVVSGSDMYNTPSNVVINADGRVTLSGAPASSTNLIITGGDNDGTVNYPIKVIDEDGYEILSVRSSLAPGAIYGNNAAKVSVGGRLEAKTFMASGISNSIDEGADFCFIGGGATNRIKNSASDHSMIGAGRCNTIGPNNSSPYAVICGGASNIVDNDYGVICGGRNNYMSRTYSFIGSGRDNVVMDDRSVICGGSFNRINEYGEACFIGGGNYHYIRSYNPSDQFNTIVGGFMNCISNSYEAFIGGGSWNKVAFGPFSTIGGGQRNEAWEKGVTICGGRYNRVVGEYCTIGGGFSNTVDGYSYYSTIPGGYSNRIYSANYSFAAGRRAQVWHNGCFVWADSNDTTVDTTTHNQFIARASGGVVFYTTANGTITGAQLPAGSGAWSSLSDRNAKENVTELNGEEILSKLMDIPISSWNYKTQADQIRHAGPMAQDFYAAYGLGEMDTMLSSVDVDGIALAAIKELKAQKDAEIGELRAMIEVLKQRLDELEPKP